MGNTYNWSTIWDCVCITVFDQMLDYFVGWFKYISTYTAVVWHWRMFIAWIRRWMMRTNMLTQNNALIECPGTHRTSIRLFTWIRTTYNLIYVLWCEKAGFPTKKVLYLCECARAYAMFHHQQMPSNRNGIRMGVRLKLDKIQTHIHQWLLYKTNW